MVKPFFSSQRMIPFVISLSFFMEAVDSTIINTAIPRMSLSLQVSPVDLKIALISYLLSLAIFIPISGWLADRFGIKKIFILSIIIFTFSSLWCGFANNLLTLSIARFIQGMGGALGIPVGRLIILRTFGRQQLILIMSRVIMVGALGMMLGPVLGGIITHYFSWHWIFWVNIPMGLCAFFLAKHYLLETEPDTHVPPLDKMGFILFGAALSGLTFGLAAISESTVSEAQSFSIIVISILLFIIYKKHSHRRPHPIVKTDLLQLRTFRVSVVGNFLCRLGFGGVPFLVPLLLQIGLGYSSEVAGLLMAPAAVGILFIKQFALPMLRTFGFKKVLIVNTFFAALSLWSFIFVNKDTSLYMIASLTFFYGFILSLQYSGMNTLAYADIDPKDMSAATSIMGTVQQLSQSFGVAVGAICLHFFSLGLHFSLSVPVFHNTFFAIGLITLISISIFIKLQSGDGQQMIAKN